MHFEYPLVFIFLILFLFCEKKCPLRLDMLYFPHINQVAKVSKKRSLVQIFKWMAWSGLIVALASPVIKKEFTISNSLERDMVLIIDASRSMDDGFFISRGENKFDTLKLILKNFIKARKYDRLGLIVFGEFAYIVTPTTFDHTVLKEMISYLKVGMAGEKRAIYDAIAMATKLLKNSKAKTKVAVLLTDGQNSAGKIPLSIVKKLLKQYGVKLYTIGVGRSKDYDLTLLKELAKDTRGEFFSAKNPKMLKEVYETINKLEPSLIKQEPIIETTYLYTYPLFVASLSLLFYLFLLNRSEV